MNRAKVYEYIDDERARQSAKWGGVHAWGTGDCSSPAVRGPVKMTVLMEEVGEVARALLDGNADQLETELVQVAAVAVAWLESL
jgi:hypothetical protein